MHNLYVRTRIQNTYIHTYIHLYIHTHTHTHTHIYIYIYILALIYVDFKGSSYYVWSLNVKYLGIC